MREELLKALESTGYPAYLQGSFTDEDDYTETFFTFWQFQSDHHYYDNLPTVRDHGYWVYCYSDDPVKIELLMQDLEQKLRVAGFIVEGGAIDVKSDVASHTGKMISVYYKEVFNENI